jgi:hypothetical protein
MKPSMTELEAERARVFRGLHAGKLGRHLDMPAERFTYEVSETGIGAKIVVRCRCGDSLDITDYESW